MPELPEVETIRRQLDTVLPGKEIKDVVVFKDKSFGGNSSSLVGKEIERVRRRAKIVEIWFRGWEKLVVIHLKMTGQLVYLADDGMRVVGGHPSADWVADLPNGHTRVVWDFTDGSKLFFNDMRIFGWMKIVDREKYEKERMGVPDVTDKEFDFKYLKLVLSKSGRAVKLVLTDQNKIGGIGNIYANDSLYLAGVSPVRKANSLGDREIRELRKAVVEVILRGIKFGGSSAADEKYVNAFGQKGKYQEHFLVYEKAGQVCKRDGEKIRRGRLGGRSMFYCPKCQN